jgi:Ala-tRNA(Pro) deacylase
MLSPQQLFARLDELGLAHNTVEHAPVFTVEQAKAHRGALPGHHIKNLFLRNKKEQMWLVVALEDRAIDLKRLGELLGAGRLSFGSPERLGKYLGVEPGSVTPFAVINDSEHKVTLVLDEGLRAGLQADGPINAHPLANNMTSAISLADLLRFFEATGHAPRWLDLESSGALPA